jgi:fucose permease
MMVGRLVLGLGGQWFESRRHKLSSLDGGVVVALLATMVLCAASRGLVAEIALLMIGLSLSIMLPVLYKTAQDLLGDALAARMVFYESTAATLGCALVPATAGIWLQWRGASSLEPFLVVLALVMTGAHVAAKRYANQAGVQGRAGWNRTVRMSAVMNPTGESVRESAHGEDRLR